MWRRLRLFDHFSLVAPFYDRVIRTKAIDRLRVLADLAEDDFVLDAGGGTGRIAQELRPHVRGICVLDRSLGMLAQAMAKDGLISCLGGVEALPFADHRFAKIVAVDTFHHFRQQDAAAAELLRVLAPGGRLVIEEPDIRQFSVKLVALGETLALMRSHFHPPAALVHYFSTPVTRVRVVEQAPNYWVVVEKDPSS
ncbi:MAG: methyltransferase domain-containing protein [Anaerolineae bacterium]|nr:methyltransferase domain-containing protein [Anaerolineae bacterium]